MFTRSHLIGCAVGIFGLGLTVGITVAMLRAEKRHKELEGEVDTLTYQRDWRSELARGCQLNNMAVAKSMALGLFPETQGPYEWRTLRRWETKDLWLLERTDWFYIEWPVWIVSWKAKPEFSIHIYVFNGDGERISAVSPTEDGALPIVSVTGNYRLELVGAGEVCVEVPE